MCGIFGILSKNSENVTPHIISGLKVLEYRGYDSAGIAVMDSEASSIQVQKAVGKLNALEEELKVTNINGVVGIGHTRWATHGKPSTLNAHPLCSDKVAVVHNGIIENYTELKQELLKNGFSFKTETDTEVLPYLIEKYLSDGPVKAVRKVMQRVEGNFALVAIFKGKNNLMVGCKRGSPLSFSLNEEYKALASDTMALSKYFRGAITLQDNEMVVLSDTSGYELYNYKCELIERPMHSIASSEDVSKGSFPHFMLKEIYEQPEVIKNLVERYTESNSAIDTISWHKYRRVYIIACGASYHAGLTAKCWFEEIAKVPVSVEVASAFRDAGGALEKDALYIFISQSGETADTLGALKWVKSYGCDTLGIVNVAGSSIAMEVSSLALTFAGPEVGVASTKAFTAQLTILALMALKCAKSLGVIDTQFYNESISELNNATEQISRLIAEENKIKEIAKCLLDSRHLLYIGRHLSYPLALEGALKLKELSYIFAEGLAAGELKHGPLALIDNTVPVIAIAPSDRLFSKMKGNIQEIEARGGKVVMIGDSESIDELKHLCYKTFEVAKVKGMAIPFCYIVPLQLLSYYVALLLGKDIDRPRNLAKSVTVE